MTYTEILHLIPGELVVTIYGDTAMVISVSQQSGFVTLDIPNKTRECCAYYRDYEIKCRVCDLSNLTEDSYGIF